MADVKYLSSTDVRVFPTAFRKSVSVTDDNTTTQTTYNPESKLNTEFNLTTMAARLADRSTFVLNYAESDDVMTVSMHGYWFELKNVKSKRTEGKPLWAAIRIYDPNTAASDNSKFSLPTLYSLNDSTSSLDNMNLDDKTGDFFGLGLYDSAPVSADGSYGTLYSLQLFDGDGNVPDSSYLKISTGSVSDGLNSDKPISKEFTTKKATITDNFNYSGIESTDSACSWNSLWFSNTNNNISAGTPLYSANLQYYPCTGILKSVDSTTNYTKTARLYPDKLTFRTACNDPSVAYKYESALDASAELICMYWKPEANKLTDATPMLSVAVDSDTGDVTSHMRSNTGDGSSITLETIGKRQNHSKLVIGHRKIEGYAVYDANWTDSPTFSDTPVLSISCDATATGTSSTVSASSIDATKDFNYSGINEVNSRLAAPFELWVSNSTNSKGTPQLLSAVTWAPIAQKLTVSGSIDTTGGVTVGASCEAQSFNATSDRRLKENVVDYVCDKSILDLPIKKFDFIDGPKRQIGCIAQDLREICPEIVHEGEDGYLSIQESKIVYLLLQEVKRLREEVNELKGGK